MGYLGNHLATLVTGLFAVALTVTWYYFLDLSVLNFIFIMAVPITCFLTFTCWISQKSTDYMHNNAHQLQHHKIENPGESIQIVQTTAVEKHIDLSEIKQIQNELYLELNSVKESVKLKDGEIERLNQEISNLKTRVQIESLKTELANLKILSSKNKNLGK